MARVCGVEENERKGNRKSPSFPHVTTQARRDDMYDAGNVVLPANVFVPPTLSVSVIYCGLAVRPPTRTGSIAVQK